MSGDDCPVFWELLDEWECTMPLRTVSEPPWPPNRVRPYVLPNVRRVVRW